MREILVVIAIVVVVLLGFMWVWNLAEKETLSQCKEKYGQEYIVGHSSANSSVYWCESPEGDMKAL